jgi:starch synthase
MNILFVSSEVAPLAKVGGLGDVAAALPKQLRADGHDVRLFLPMYARIRAQGRPLETVVPRASVELGGVNIHFSVYSTPLPGSSQPVYLVSCPALYDRPNVYTSDPDEHLRFIVLTWAALKTCQILRFAPDIAHVNDWQTALLPLILRTALAWDRLFEKTRTVLTIHNIGHQGTFDARILPSTGLASVAQHFHQDQLRQGKINFLLTGIMFAHAITTVSPTYAREIRTPEHGVGLDPFLRQRRSVLFGILNGIDESEWSPEVDGHLAHRYSASELGGKELCKRALLEEAGLPYVHEVPVVGIVSRLAWQKGFDLCMKVLPTMLARRAVQMVVLGTGEPQYEQFFTALARQFPRQVAYRGAFSEPLAHRIEAGTDMFLMPSRYEPCGLNQMYSLRYGTPPIVHRTGGLADTVVQFDDEHGHEHAHGKNPGNGFVFNHFDVGGLAWALGRALSVWGSGKGADRARWKRLQKSGMRGRYSWRERAKEYEAVYRKIAP